MKQSTLKNRVISVLVVASLLGGCSTNGIKQSRSSIDRETELLSNRSATAQSKMDTASDALMRSSSPWVGSKVVERPRGELPAAFLGKVTLVLNRDKVSMSFAASEITRVTGIPVRISADVQLQQNLPATSATQGQSTGSPFVAGQQSSASSTPQSYQAWDNSVDLNFVNVSLSDLLDQIGARMGISWEYREKDAAIYFTRYVTRTFTLHILPGTTKQSATVGKSSTATTGFSATSSSGIDSNMDTWDSVKSEITAMLTTKGKIAVSPSSQTVTVTDVRDTMDKVETYVRNLNDSMTRQIAIKVDVISVTLNKGSEFGLNWNAVWQNLAKVAPNIKLTATSIAAAGASAGGSMGLSVLTPVGGAAGPWDGSSAIFQALETVGKASVIDTRRVVTLNNQPTPVAVTNQLSYISSVTPGQLATVNSPATAPTPVISTLTTGYLLNIYPSILDDRELLLQFSVDISELLNMTTVISSGIPTQQPNLTSTQFVQRTRVKIGETVVLSGYAKKGNKYNQSGVFSADNFGFGGGFTGAEDTQEMVIMITPIISE